MWQGEPKRSYDMESVFNGNFGHWFTSFNNSLAIIQIDLIIKIRNLLESNCWQENWQQIIAV